jgi:hypothetical protein
MTQHLHKTHSFEQSLQPSMSGPAGVCHKPASKQRYSTVRVQETRFLTGHTSGKEYDGCLLLMLTAGFWAANQIRI